MHGNGEVITERYPRVISKIKVRVKSGLIRNFYGITGIAKNELFIEIFYTMIMTQ